MRVVKCTMNHFFDADKYSTCPQCGAAMGTSDSVTGGASGNSYNSKAVSSGKAKSDETFGVFKKGGFKSRKNDSAPSQPKASAGSGNYEKLKSFQPNSQGSYNPAPSPSLNPNSLLGGSTGFAKMETPPVNVVPPVQQPMASNNIQSSQESVPVFAAAPAPVSASTPVSQTTNSAAPSSEDSLMDEIRKVTSDNDGKTVGFFSSGRSSGQEESNDKEGSKDTAPANAPSDEPVVGWLVCIGGPNVGQCFNIYAGKNALGRSNNNKIIIGKDRSVSREKHAWIIYEPRNREFFALPGDSSGLTYVNDVNIMQATKLEKWSNIDVGNTKLTLVPLCSEEFSWESYL